MLWDQHGAFTTTAVCNGRIVFRSSHLQRWRDTLIYLRLDPYPWEKWLWAEADALAAAAGDKPSLLRVGTTATTATLHLRPAQPRPTSLEGVPFQINRREPGWKTLYYTEVLKTLKQTDRSHQEPLLTSPDGLLFEGATTGIVTRRGNQLILPKGPSLPSITIQQLLQSLGAEFTVTSAPIALDALDSIDEIIVAGSGRTAVSLNSIRNYDWKPNGSILQRQAVKWAEKTFAGWTGVDGQWTGGLKWT